MILCIRLAGALLSCLTLLLLTSSGAVVMEKPEAQTAGRELFSDTWTATDALGRRLPGFAECGPPRPGKFVGIFYFLWMDKIHDPGHLYDNAKLVAANPTDPQYGPEGAFHWWHEPHLGYYLADDALVIRRHAQMLTDAGVDVLFFDITNAITYDRDYLAICKVFTQIRKEGRATPQIAFLANSNSASTVQKVYENFYAKNLYPDLWFRWKGKPLLLTPPEGLSQEVREFFTLRHSWAWSDPKGWFGNGRDKWPWLDHYPQKPGWHEDPKRPEQISVCTAQHATSNIGRSFQQGKQPPPDQVAPERGLCFAEQFQRALEVDPEFIFITGWNEWIAQRFRNQGGVHFLGRSLKPGETFFVDQYNQEFSRDIEPMRGGHGDNYYYQMVGYIRRFKGVSPPPKASSPKTIRLDGSFRQWDTVRPDFLDDLGDTTHRNHPGWADTGTRINTTGRNDFELMRVARDTKNLYFYVRTRVPITAPSGANWMNLLLDTDTDHRTGWEGYDFAVRRMIVNGREVCGLMGNTGGWKWEFIAEVGMRQAGREMHLTIPRAAVGLLSEQGPLRFDFKWTDNVPESGNILDFIDKGDVAPNGRFNYRFEEQPR